MSRRFLVFDHGLFCEQANGLAAGGKNEVKYFTPFNYQYKDYSVGKNYGYLDKVLYFWEWVDWADSLVCFDVRGGDMFGWLRDKFPEKSIFSSGWGLKIEDDRVLLKKLLKSMGLPMQEYRVLRGVSELRNYLKSKSNQFVKLNIFRSDMESFYAANYESVELKLDQLMEIFGPHKEEYEFVVEEAIEKDVPEIGFDGFFSGVDYLHPYLIGYELDKNLYVGRITEDLPAALEETIFSFAPVLEKLKYRSAISTEEKIISQSEHYVLDICSRMGSSFTALYTEFIANWPEIVYAVGKGEEMEVGFSKKYVGSISFPTPEALDVYVKVDIDKGFQNRIKMLMPCGNKKGDFAVKGEEEVCTLIAGGNSLEEVLKSLKESSEHVHADGLDKKEIEGIDKILKIIDNGKKVGLDF